MLWVYLVSDRNYIFPYGNIILWYYISVKKFLMYLKGFVMQEKLLEWIDKEAPARGFHNDRAVAQAADLSPSVFSKTRKGYQPLGWEACIKIANAFNVPQHVVLVLGGHIDEPRKGWDAETEEIIDLYSKLSEKDREEILFLLRLKSSN